MYLFLMIFSFGQAKSVIQEPFTDQKKKKKEGAIQSQSGKFTRFTTCKGGMYE